MKGCVCDLELEFLTVKARLRPEWIGLKSHPSLTIFKNEGPLKDWSQ
jgi:hypothetical protein